MDDRKTVRNTCTIFHLMIISSPNVCISYKKLLHYIWDFEKLFAWSIVASSNFLKIYENNFPTNCEFQKYVKFVVFGRFEYYVVPLLEDLKVTFGKSIFPTVYQSTRVILKVTYSSVCAQPQSVLICTCFDLPDL